MAPLVILNPRRAATKKRRRKMTAKQLKFFGPRKSKKSKKKKARAKKRPSVIIVSNNPKGTAVAKKRRRHRRKAKVFTHNPRKRSRHKFRRNPRSIQAGFVNNTLLPAAIGAAGAVGADMLVNYLPMPPQFRNGMVMAGVKIAASLLVGVAVGAVSSREAGEEAAAGGVIVTLYGLARGFMATNGIGGGMSRYAPMNRYAPMRRFNPGMRGVVAPNAPPAAFLQKPGGADYGPGLGYMNPARVTQVPSRGAMRYMVSQRGQ